MTCVEQVSKLTRVSLANVSRCDKFRTFTRLCEEQDTSNRRGKIGVRDTLGRYFSSLISVGCHAGEDREFVSNKSRAEARKPATSLSFPPVKYLDHGFSLLPHPTTGDLLCVGRGGIAVTNEHEADWLMARRLGVTASGFGDLVTRAGAPSKSRLKAVKSKVLGIERDIGYVQAIELGNSHEELIAERVDRDYGVAANHWLVAEAEVPRFLATPDGLSTDLVAEYKTSIKSWGHNLHTYYRQIQWQLSVTNRSQAVFAVLHPYTKVFMAGLVPRDEAEIELLRTVASEVLKELDAYGESEEARLALEVSKFTLTPAPRNRKLETPEVKSYPGDEWTTGTEGVLPF